MSFLNVAGFGLALLLPLIVLMYLLKLRRDERPVSSTYLWRRMVRDVQANVPWQRLQRNILLILQLLFLGALILAIARPASQSAEILNQSLILVIDTSASMAANDVEPSRIEKAKQTAFDLVKSLSSNARVTVIAAGIRPRTLVSLNADRRAVNQAISQIRAEPGESDMASALQIAAAITRRQQDALTVMLSDGNVEMPQFSSLPGTFRFVPIGASNKNQAVQMLSLQTNPADLSLTAFAQVANYSREAVARRLGFFADGALISTADLDIPPGSEQSALVSGVISTTQVIEARLLESETGIDFLALDDRAFAVNRQTGTIKTVLVSQGNLFLETAFSLIPSLDLLVINPGDPIDAQAELLVLDGNVPAGEISPGANILFIAPPASTEFFTVTGKLDLPIPIKAEPVNPLVEHVDLSGVNILDAVKITPQKWAMPLIEDRSSITQTRDPLLFVGEKEGRRIAVLAFELSRSDLPLQVAFPILISNLMTWLAPGGLNLAPAEIQPGMPINLAGFAHSEGAANSIIRITRPDGSRVEIDPATHEPVFNETDQLGLYSISTNGKDVQQFAVNLFSPQESQIAPTRAAHLTGAENSPVEVSAISANHEWWRLIALLAVILLSLEWLVYHRATLSELLQRLLPSRSRTGAHLR